MNFAGMDTLARLWSVYCPSVLLFDSLKSVWLAMPVDAYQVINEIGRNLRADFVWMHHLTLTNKSIRTCAMLINTTSMTTFGPCTATECGPLCYLGGAIPKFAKYAALVNHSVQVEVAEGFQRIHDRVKNGRCDDALEIIDGYMNNPVFYQYTKALDVVKTHIANKELDTESYNISHSVESSMSIM
eukprot:m51a1_g11240 hypothetical protein (186) ;mRNA; r:7768-9832